MENQENSMKLLIFSLSILIDSHYKSQEEEEEEKN